MIVPTTIAVARPNPIARMNGPCPGLSGLAGLTGVVGLGKRTSWRQTHGPGNLGKLNIVSTLRRFLGYHPYGGLPLTACGSREPPAVSLRSP
jgi:hypothetical protein